MSFDASDEEGDSIFFGESDEFEQEMASQLDLHTPSSAVDLSDRASASTVAMGSHTATGNDKAESSCRGFVATATPSEAHAPVDAMFHTCDFFYFFFSLLICLALLQAITPLLRTGISTEGQISDTELTPSSPLLFAASLKDKEFGDRVETANVDNVYWNVLGLDEKYRLDSGDEVGDKSMTPRYEEVEVVTYTVDIAGDDRRNDPVDVALANDFLAGESGEGRDSTSDAANGQMKDANVEITNFSKNNSNNRSSDTGGQNMDSSNSTDDVKVHVPLAGTPYGKGYLRPGGCLTFCAEPFRPSLWQRVLQKAVVRPKMLSDDGTYEGVGFRTKTTLNSEDDRGVLCEAQMLTLSEKGVVLLQKIDVASSSASTSSPHSPHFTSNSSGVLWKGNYFPLWRRLLRRLKPLPVPALLYMFAENNLTIWRTKQSDSVKEDDCLVDGGDDSGERSGEGVEEHTRKQWKYFKAKSLLLESRTGT